MKFNCGVLAKEPINFLPEGCEINLNPNIYQNEAGEPVFDVEIHLSQPLDILDKDTPHGKAGEATGERGERRLYTYPASMLKQLLKDDEYGLTKVPNWDAIAPLFFAEGLSIVQPTA